MNSNLSGLKLFITGGAGFIGSTIVKSLVKKGVVVTIFDNLSTGSLKNLEDVRHKVNFIKGDILNYKRLKEASKGFDAISHQAAQLEIMKGYDDAYLDVNDNLIGTINITRVAAENNIRKIINASSACVYGQNILNLPSNEKSQTNPNWAYGVSKLAAEKYLDIYANDYSSSIFNLRYSIVYGPNEWYGRVLTIFLKRAYSNEPIVIFGNGRQVRDFVYVEDVASAHNLALMSSLKGSNTFNISSGKATSINQLAELVKTHLNTKLDIIHENVKEGEASKYVKGRIRLPVELKTMWLDNKSAIKKLSWKPKVQMIEGINKEFSWIKTNHKRWNRIRI